MALVVSILKGETSVAEAARKHGLTVAEIEDWRERLVVGTRLIDRLAQFSLVPGDITLQSRTFGPGLPFTTATASAAALSGALSRAMATPASRPSASHCRAFEAATAEPAVAAGVDATRGGRAEVVGAADRRRLLGVVQDHVGRLIDERGAEGAHVEPLAASRPLARHERREGGERAGTGCTSGLA